MKKGRIILISVVAVIIVIVLTIGGKMYMDNKKEQKKLDIEKQSVKVLKKTFADLARVKIERTGYNKMTGSYRMVITMTNKQGNSAHFSYGFVENEDELGSYGIVDENVQKQGTTTTKIRVIFSDESEEDI
ncbi:hypothetical protein [Listeria welshimeri]|uniref:hypothetical protein n=1 Tax=Listeria welshimeri TaxID=1643 RepID=UPI00162A3B2E|nr:hypothetical protein [Listeria welshimeri]MBC1476511.1 hypothetical protein [Listeria welshimeri]MBC2041907.1 hypothetical protein [Listeria welshimeri]MBF2340315.1 hypothetical protein [Listeria welshimeri]MBF2423572.1 hypothetical protein [Listeria welshimeri]MBF2428040.1 hypothetical protein [Listeria welshimeri]